jgi:N-sulfoglucosamine sulfohydrolase
LELLRAAETPVDPIRSGDKEDIVKRPFLFSTTVCLLWTSLLWPGVFVETSLSAEPRPSGRPNVLFIIADDHSWPHTGAYGDTIVKTPAFDSLARQGVLFNYAYSAAASCTISRNAILTGQQPWRLEEGALFGGTLARKFDVFPLLLEDAGYEVAWAGKSWGPGDLKAGGWGNRHPAGRQTRPPGIRPANFERFLADRPKDRPFFFWFGSTDPHRTYKPGSGIASGKKLEDVTVPPFWPDVPEVRSDILDYYVEVENFDRQVGQLLRALRQNGVFENTIVIVTSDHGMPFPRCKADCYDMSNHVPLVISWPAKLPGGRVVDDFASLTDVAPTLLEAAAAHVPPSMTGRSLMGVLTSTKSGLVDPSRDFVVTSYERHGWCRPNGATYPIRAIRTHGQMYLWNLEPDRWPNGDPSFPAVPYPGRGTEFMDIDPSPTKTYVIEHSKKPEAARSFEVCLGKRPGEELYDMKTDPHQMRNLATESAHAAIKSDLRERLEAYLRETDDPRMVGENPFDYYPLRYRLEKPLVPRRPN